MRTPLKELPPYVGVPEKPIGRGQLDYVRRLARDLAEAYNGKNRPRAVGIVGSDVYDKLLLLQALRPIFGDAIFFTTDLDARLSHHKQSKWTRNLIVASHFGLTPGRHLSSKNTTLSDTFGLTFRDSYQTALYFTCREILDDPVAADVLKEPECNARLFEIGYDRAAPLATNPTTCDRLSLNENWLSRVGFGVIGVVLAGFLAFHVSPGFRSLFVFDGTRRCWSRLVLALSAFLIIVTVFIVGLCDNCRANGEPFSLTLGVSLWPSTLLFLAAGFLGIHFIVKSLRELEIDALKTAQRFGLENVDGIHFTWPENPDWHRALRWLAPAWQWLTYRWRIGIDCWTASAIAPDQSAIDANKVWGQYLELSKPSNVWQRVLSMSFTYVFFGLALFGLFGWPRIPYRGGLSWSIGWAACVFAMFTVVTLIFLVVDATKLCQQFIRNLSVHSSAWNISGGSSYLGGRQLDDNVRAEWLDVRITAARTKVVGKLIQYPVIVLFLIYLARHSFLDNWNWPLSMVVWYLLAIFYAVGCALVLRSSANRARRKALDCLRAHLIRCHSDTADTNRVKRIETTIQEIENLQEGAYTALHENPIVSAILIPSSGVTLIALIEAISNM